MLKETCLQPVFCTAFATGALLSVEVMGEMYIGVQTARNVACVKQDE